MRDIRGIRTMHRGGAQWIHDGQSWYGRIGRVTNEGTRRLCVVKSQVKFCIVAVCPVTDVVLIWLKGGRADPGSSMVLHHKPHMSAALDPTRSALMHPCLVLIRITVAALLSLLDNITVISCVAFEVGGRGRQSRDGCRTCDMKVTDSTSVAPRRRGVRFSASHCQDMPCDSLRPPSSRPAAVR